MKKLLFSLVLVLLCFTSVYAITDANNGKLKIYRTYDSYEGLFNGGFDIHGYLNSNNKLDITSTYGNYGFHVFLNVDSKYGNMSGLLSPSEPVEGVDYPTRPNEDNYSNFSDYNTALTNYNNLKQQAMDQYDNDYSEFILNAENYFNSMLYPGGNARNIDGIDIVVNNQFINNGNFIKLTYSVTNTTDKVKTYSLGTMGDLELDGDPNAKLVKTNGKSLYAYTNSGTTKKKVQFVLYGNGVDSVTDVDNVWIGEWDYANYLFSMFNNNPSVKEIDNDSSFSYSWVNRTINPHETINHSVILSISEVNAPTVTITTPSNKAYKKDDSVIIKGSVEDVDLLDEVSIYYKVDNMDSIKLTNLELNGTKKDFSINLDSLELSKEEYHTISVWAQDSLSNKSKTVSISFIRQLVTPPNLSIKSNTNSLILNWDAQEDATSYVIYRSLKSSSGFKEIGETTNLYYEDTDLVYGYTYYYRAISTTTYNGNIERGKTYSSISKSLVPKKLNLNVKKYNDSAISLSWEKDSTVTGYKLYRSTDNKTWKLLKTIKGNNNISYTNKKLTPGKTYYYLIRSYKTVNKKDVLGSKSNIVYEKVRPYLVTFNVLKNDSKSLKIKWTKVRNATSYQIYDYVNSKTYTSKKNYLIVKGLTLGEKYNFSVRACINYNNKNVCGSYNEPVEQIVSPGIPTYKIINTSKNSIRIVINPVDGADNFIVSMTRVGEDGHGNTLGNDLTFTDLIEGETYTVSINSYNEEKGLTGNTTKTTVVIRPKTPTLSISTTDFNKVKLEWDAEEIDKYLIYRSTTKNGKYTLIGETTDGSFINKIKYNTAYYYKVKGLNVVNNKNVYSGFSNIVGKKIKLSTPTVKVSNNTYNSLKISINDVSYRTGFEIYSSTSKNGDYKKIVSTTDLEYIVNKLSFNKAYYYKVRAYRSYNGKRYYGGFSSVVGKKTILNEPTNIMVTKEDNYLSITWDKTPGAIGYQVYYSDAIDGSYILLGKALSNIVNIEITDRFSDNVFIKVRSYRKDGKNNIFSKFSEIKSININEL